MISNYSILAVDDEPFNLDLIEASFADDNVQITFAINGQNVLNLLEQKDYDVVLLDINMPIIDGMEILKSIRANKKFDLLPVLMVTANTEREHEALELGASDFISKPYDVEVLRARTLNYAKLHYLTKQVSNQNLALEEQVKIRTQELEHSLRLSKEAEFEISTRLGRASESRDPDTGGHIKRMSHYSRLLAELYGLSESECEIVLYASPLHDIGKIAIEDKVLLKPGKLEKNEFDIMKTHASIGAKMLEGADRFPVLKAGRIIALEHHEKYDGTGYPNSKAGDEIHIYARIVAIADVFDALSAKRCYKDAIAYDKVIEIMSDGAGTHFDTRLIKLFLDNIDKFLEIKERFKDEYYLPTQTKEVTQETAKIKILFVDDNDLNRLVVQEMLLLIFPELSIDTFECADDVLGLNLNEYSFILSDIDMPCIDGYELYDLLRKEYNYTKPIIAVTALAVAGDKEKMLAHGFDAYISKPIDLQELEDTLNQYI